MRWCGRCAFKIEGISLCFTLMCGLHVCIERTHSCSSSTLGLVSSMSFVEGAFSSFFGCGLASFCMSFLFLFCPVTQGVVQLPVFDLCFWLYIVEYLEIVEGSGLMGVCRWYSSKGLSLQVLF